MGERDLLILFVFLIVVVYVCYTAFNSMSDWVVYKFDDAELQKQLQEQGLNNLLSIRFNFAKQYELGTLKELAINIENRSQVSLIYANWDNSSLTDLTGRARRIVRKTPDMSPDLFQAQVTSTISPGQRLQEKLVVEDSLRPNPKDQSLKVMAPLINIPMLARVKGQQKLYADFMACQASIPFFLKLVLQVFDPSVGSGSKRFHVLTCNFSIQKQPWLAHFKR